MPVPVLQLVQSAPSSDETLATGVRGASTRTMRWANALSVWVPMPLGSASSDPG